MNIDDRKAIAAVSEQIRVLSEHLKALEYLTDPKTVQALKDLVQVAPTLCELTEGYRAASWFGRFIKWIGAIGAAVLAVIAIWAIYFGEAK